MVTAVPADRLRELNEQLLAVPDGFTLNPKLAKQLERRRDALREGGIDWGQAESLAFASLLGEGIPIRLSGQDTERGTFSHRHAVLHDPVSGETYTPLQNLPSAAASFEIYNSPLSEYAPLAFEYGYSIAAPDALVLWEAQFGDFINGAQIVIDQFIVSGRSKWGQTSRLTLLLPHGYEGNGPEHSSARLERLLQLAAQENIRIANTTTAAQFFHLLRRQALDATARPLVVMTPKGLLRLRSATSTLDDLSDGAFKPVLGDPSVQPEDVRRLVLTTGKLYYDIVGHEARESAGNVAVARIEFLYPFPLDAGPRPRRRLPEPPGDRVGAGGAAEHGRVAFDPPSPRGGGRELPRRPGELHRPSLACEPERGLSDAPPARAGPDRPRGARRSLARPVARRACCGCAVRPRTPHAARGDEPRSSTRRRSSGGNRRQILNAASSSAMTILRAKIIAAHRRTSSPPGYVPNVSMPLPGAGFSVRSARLPRR